MSAAVHHLGPENPALAEVIKLTGAGLKILPLVEKRPAVKDWAKSPPPLSQTLAILRRTGSRTFGIRLDDSAIIDLDTDDCTLAAQVESRFGETPLHVRTPRGRHLFYRHSGGRLPNLRGEGLPIDIKAGPAAFVVAPGSIRPDGGTYTFARGGVADFANLPTIRLSQAAPTRRTAVGIGNRHNELIRRAIEYCPCCDNQDELFDNLLAVRDDWPDPASFPDSEVASIAAWTWSKRLENNLWSSRANSVVQVRRSDIDALIGRPDAVEAAALFLWLCDAHGHLPGKMFAIAGPEMIGKLPMSRRQWVKAIAALVDTGLLIVAKPHCVGRHGRLYQIGRAIPGGVQRAPFPSGRKA